MILASAFLLSGNAYSAPANGLVGFYPLDDNANDYSGYQNNGVVDGGTWVAGVKQMGLKFDGVDDYGNIPYSASLNTSTFTVAFWWSFSDSDLNPSNMIIVKRNSQSQIFDGNYAVAYLPNPGPPYTGPALLAAIGDGVEAFTAVNDSVQLEENKFYHIAVTYDQSHLRLYLDGTEIAQTAATITTNPGSGPISLGWSGDLTYYYSAGTMDELYLYDRALSGNEISDLYNLLPKPLAYYPFEENFSDATGNGYDLSAGPSFTYSWVTGRYGQAIDIPSQTAAPPDETKKAPHADDLYYPGTGGWTVMGWTKLEGDRCGYIVQQYTAWDNHDPFRLMITNDDMFYFHIERNTDKEIVTYPTADYTGQWVHVAGVYDYQSSVKLYINGKLKGTTPTSLVPDSLQGFDTYVGGDTWGSDSNCALVLDDVRVYDKALSEEQIMVLVNNEPNIPYSPSPADGTSVAEIDSILSWLGGDRDAGDVVTYDLYFGTSDPPSMVVSDYSPTTYDPDMLDYDTMYYWKVVARDQDGAESEGALWGFRTKLGETILGQVFTTVTGKNEPVVGAAIEVGDSVQTDTSDTHGNFRLEGVPPGSYELTIEKENFSTLTVSDVVVTTAETTVLSPIELAIYMCEDMFTQEEVDQAVATAEAAKDVIIAEKDQMIADLMATMDTMYTEEDFNEAVQNAVATWDVNGDGTIGLDDIIRWLQYLSGVRIEP
jgi:hypothetical protein